MEFFCKRCAATLSGDVAFVPSRGHFPIRFDRIEVLKNVYCGGCVRWRDIKKREVVPLFDILALLDQQAAQRERQMEQPARQPIGKIVKVRRTETKQAASRRERAEAEAKARRAEADRRHNTSLTAIATGHAG